MGISATIASIVDAVSTAGAAAAASIGGEAAALGIGGTATTGLAGALGTGAVGALTGAGLGAAEAGITGGDPLKGAEFGGISGGVLGGAGGALGTALGSSTAGDILAGSAGGVLGAAATGESLASGALGGAVSGGVSAALGGSPASGGTGAPGASPAAPIPGGGVGSAAATAAPPGVAATGSDFSTPGVEAVTVTPGFDTPDAGVLGLTGGGFGAGGGSTGASQLQSVAPESGQTQSNTNIQNSLATSNTPGSVGAGAATGTQTLAGGAPPQIGAGAGPAVSSGTSGPVAPQVGPSTSVGKFLENPSLSSGWDVLSSNPLPILAGGALAFDAIQGNSVNPGGAPQSALNTQAAQDVTTGNALQSYLLSGTLPSGLQSSVNSATSAAEAAVRQQYANRGMSGSSAEAQDLANVQSQAVQQSANLATQLFQQGVNESNLGSQIYNDLMKVNLQQDQNLSSSVTGFVSALAGLNRPIQINTGGVTTG